MKKSKIIKQGDIHLIPFPFTDLSNSKLRPCVILGHDREDMVVIFITGVKPKDKFFIKIEPSKTNGVKVTSYIRYTKIATLDVKTSLGEIGSLEKDIYKNVTEKIKGYICKI